MGYKIKINNFVEYIPVVQKESKSSSGFGYSISELTNNKVKTEPASTETVEHVDSSNTEQKSTPQEYPEQKKSKGYSIKITGNEKDEKQIVSTSNQNKQKSSAQVTPEQKPAYEYKPYSFQKSQQPLSFDSEKYKELSTYHVFKTKNIPITPWAADVLTVFKDAGIPVRVVSSYSPNRPNPKSHHISGNAVDITPIYKNGKQPWNSETWVQFKETVYGNKHLRDVFSKHGIGIYDEATMKQQGMKDQPYHLHVGPDYLALRDWSNYSVLANIPR